MPDGWASVDGGIVPLADACWPVDDPAITVGWTVFETAQMSSGEVHALDRHLDRLYASAAAARVPLPSRDALADRARVLARHHGGLGRLRITCSGSGRVVLTATDVDPSRRGRPVRCVRGPHVDEPFLGGGVKHGSRAPWVVAVARSGADEVLLVDGQGRFTEGTTSGVLAVVDGVLWTAPDDGRILASTSVLDLLAKAERMGIPVERTGARAEGPWDGLYIASATRGLAPVVSLDGVDLPGWEQVGRWLAHVDG